MTHTEQYEPMDRITPDFAAENDQLLADYHDVFGKTAEFEINPNERIIKDPGQLAYGLTRLTEPRVGTQQLPAPDLLLNFSQDTDNAQDLTAQFAFSIPEHKGAKEDFESAIMHLGEGLHKKPKVEIIKDQSGNFAHVTLPGAGVNTLIQVFRQNGEEPRPVLLAAIGKYQEGKQEKPDPLPAPENTFNAVDTSSKKPSIKMST